TRTAGATLQLIGIGSDLGATTNSRLQISGGTTPFNNGVLGWATISGPSGFDLVTDADGNANTGPFFFGRVTSYSTDINAGGIVRLSGTNAVLTADRTVDAILLENGATVTGPFTLTIGSGATAGQSSVIAAVGTGNSIGSNVVTFDGANAQEG